MIWKAGVILAAIALVAWLAFSGETREQVYQRGYDDGISDLCGDIEHFSRQVFERLRQNRLC